jgi:hypothetical protein
VNFEGAIGFRCQGAAANPHNLPASRLRFGLAVLKVYSHIRSCFGQRHRSRPPDATAAAGDKGYFPSQFVVHILGESLRDGAGDESHCENLCWRPHFVYNGR